MTKVTVLGQSQGEEPKKKIQFTGYLIRDATFEYKSLPAPSAYKNLILLSRDYLAKGDDLIFGYDEDPNSSGTLFILATSTTA